MPLSSDASLTRPLPGGSPTVQVKFDGMLHRRFHEGLPRSHTTVIHATQVPVFRALGALGDTIRQPICDPAGLTATGPLRCVVQSVHVTHHLHLRTLEERVSQLQTGHGV